MNLSTFLDSLTSAISGAAARQMLDGKTQDEINLLLMQKVIEADANSEAAKVLGTENEQFITSIFEAVLYIAGRALGHAITDEEMSTLRNRAVALVDDGTERNEALWLAFNEILGGVKGDE